MRILITASIFLLFFCIAAADQKLDYLAYLLRQKQLLEASIMQIADVNSNLMLNLKLNAQVDYQQKLTASAIRDQHDIAIDALSHTFASLSLKANCTQTKNEFENKITDIQSQLDKASSTVASQPPCLRNDYIKANFKLYQTLCDGLRQETVLNCTAAAASLTNIPFLDTKSTKFVPNTGAAAPWVYGAITAEQYNAKRSELISVNSAADCLAVTPFLDQNNTCIACSSNTVYDISIKKCRECEVGTTYNQNLHQCITFTAIFNSKINDNANYLGTAPTFNSAAATCPDDKPFFDGKSCISCSLPMYFSFLTSNCEACKNDAAFDSSSKSCVSTTFFLSNLNGLNNFIGSSLSPLPYDNIKTCPPDQPFSNGKQCFSCPLPQFYNFESMSCQSCPAQYSFDSKIHSCVSSNSANTFINSNLISSRNFIGKLPLFNNLFKSCETNAPFFNGKECISCPLPSYFDFDALSCTPCLAGLSFNTLIQTCEYINQDYYTDVNAKNIYYNGVFQNVQSQINEKKSKNSKMKACPSNTPFYNSRSNTCIGCAALLPLFDFKTNKCMACPSGSEFDEESHLCLTKKVSATIQRMIMNTV